MPNEGQRVRERRCYLIITLMLVLIPFAIPSSMHVQSEMALRFGPTPGKAEPLFSVQEAGHFVRDVKGQKMD